MSQGPINSGIQGFLSYLGLKQQGQNVSALADQVIPTINIDPFYQIGSEIPFTAFYTSPIGTLDQVVATIPQGKAWAITKIGAYFTNGVGNSFRIFINYRKTYGTTTGVVPLAEGVLYSGSAFTEYVPEYAYWVGKAYETPIYLTGGSEIRVTNSAIFGVAQQWSFYVTYKEMDL